MKKLLLILLLGFSQLTLATNRDSEDFYCTSGRICVLNDFRYLRVTHYTNFVFQAVVRDLVQIQVDGPGCQVVVNQAETHFDFNSRCDLRMKLINGYEGTAAVYFEGGWSFDLVKRRFNDPTLDHLHYEGINSDIQSLSNGGTRRWGRNFSAYVGYDDEIFLLKTKAISSQHSVMFDDVGFFEAL